MAKGQWPRETDNLEAAKIGQILDRMMIAWTIAVIPSLKPQNVAVYCSGTDLFDKKPNFYNLAQIQLQTQQNIIKLLERPKS